MRSMSKNRVPLVSAKPSLLPMMLNAWHGKPPVRMSWSGTSAAPTFAISPKGLLPKLASYMAWHGLSHSEVKTHSPPARSKAIRMPPIPANRSMNLNPICGFADTCILHASVFSLSTVSKKILTASFCLSEYLSNLFDCSIFRTLPLMDLVSTYFPIASGDMCRRVSPT